MDITLSAEKRAGTIALSLFGAAGIAIAAAMTFLYGDSGAVATFAAFCFFLMLGALLISGEKISSREKFSLLAAFFIGFLLRYCCAQFFMPFYLENWTNFSDSRFYIDVARLLVDHYPQNPVTSINNYNYIKPIGHPGFYIFAWLHFLIDGSPQLMSATNTFMSAITILLAFRITRRLFNDKSEYRVAVASAWITALFPMLIFWSAPYIKASLIMLICVFFIDQATRFLEGKLKGPMFWMLASIIVMSNLRIYMSAMMLAAMLTAAVALVFSDRKPEGYTALAGAMLLAVFAFVALKPSLPFVGYIDFETIAKKGLVAFVLDNRSGLSGDAASIASTSPASLLQMIPYGVPRAIMAPLFIFLEGDPHKYRVITWLAPTWHIILPFSLFGIIELIRKKTLLSSPVIIFVAATSIFLALVFAGRPTRHMVMLYPLFCVFAAAGFAQFKKYLPYAFAFYALLAGVTMQYDIGGLKSVMPIYALGLLGPAAYVFFLVHARYASMRNRGARR